MWFAFFKNKIRYTQTEKLFNFPSGSHFLRITGINFVDDPIDLRRLALVEPIEQKV